MPRGKKPAETTPRQQAIRDWIDQTGVLPDLTIRTWDPDAQKLVNLVFDLLALGESITIRPGTGGLSIGIQVWTWEVKRPYVWFNDWPDIDTWVEKMQQMVEAEKVARTS